MPCQDWSREQGVTWDRTPLGLETATPCQPRAALAGEGSERRWNPETGVPALHREAERDTTGSISRQPPVHTWIGGPAQGKRMTAGRRQQGNRERSVAVLQQSPLFWLARLSSD